MSLLQVTFTQFINYFPMYAFVGTKEECQQPIWFLNHACGYFDILWVGIIHGSVNDG